MHKYKAGNCFMVDKRMWVITMPAGARFYDGGGKRMPLYFATLAKKDGTPKLNSCRKQFTEEEINLVVRSSNQLVLS